MDDCSDAAGLAPRRSALHEVTAVSLRGWLLAGFATVVVVAICYSWVDRPVARLMHHTIAYNPLWRTLTHLPDFLTLGALAVLIVVPLLAWRAGGFGRLKEQPHVGGALLAGASFVLSAFVKTVLKWGFGRSWPETWVHGNPSFIRDGVYGFHPFHGGAGYASFPSGHMTAVMSVVAVGWQLWPRLAPLWIVAAVGAAVGLIGMNFHFVSDVIAGAYVGSASAAAVLWMARRWGYQAGGGA